LPLRPPQMKQVMASYRTRFPHGEWVSTDNVSFSGGSFHTVVLLSLISILTTVF